MDRVFRWNSKYNQQKNIVKNIYCTKNLGLKNYNICDCNFIKFIPEKIEDSSNNLSCKTCKKFDIYLEQCCKEHSEWCKLVDELWETNLKFCNCLSSHSKMFCIQ